MHRLLLIGNFENFHVGYHFREAAKELGIPVETVDVRIAYHGNYIFNKLLWHLGQKRMQGLSHFNELISQTTANFQATLLLNSSMVPIYPRVLTEIKNQGILSFNFLSDNPFNPANARPWANSYFKYYDYLLTPRKSLFSEANKLNGTKIEYLPFAYNPKIHFKVPHLSSEDRLKYATDVMFYGGADLDRITYIRHVIQNQIKLKLYGGYWGDFKEFRPYWMGNLPIEEIRKAVAASKMVLNLVRHANKDGHTMRSFEAIAMGGCVLMEDTTEHRELFGDSVPYFDSGDALIKQISLLTSNDLLRQKYITMSIKALINGKHTYVDRLLYCLELSKLLTN